MKCLDCKKPTATLNARCRNYFENQCWKCGGLLCRQCVLNSNTLGWYELSNGFDILICNDCRPVMDNFRQKKSAVRPTPPNPVPT